MTNSQRKQGSYPWLNAKILGAYLIILVAALAALGSLVINQQVERWQTSVSAGLDLVGPSLHDAAQQQDVIQIKAILAALSRIAPFETAEVRKTTSDFRLLYPDTPEQALNDSGLHRGWLTLWPYSYRFGDGQYEVIITPDPDLLESSIIQQFFTLALIATGLLAAAVGVHGLYWQWSVQRPLLQILKEIRDVRLERPARHLLAAHRHQRMMQEMDELASYINQLLLVIDNQQQNRKQVEEQLKAHQRNLSKIVQSRTAELVELNKKFVQQQFDAKTSALEAKQARWEAEKANQDKTRFLAAASHDLRQPLHAMSLFVEALRPQLTNSAAISIHDNLKRSLETMKELFNALLDISKLEAGVLQPQIEHFSVQRILDRLEVVYRQQAIEKDLDLRIGQSHYTLHSDPHLLEQVISNLVGNAIKYTESGYVLVGCKRYKDSIRFMVWDSGPGIPKNEHNSIFKEFVQLANPERDRSKGLGLGLSIVKRTCQLLDHEIRFLSTPGNGTRFEIIVPLGQAPVIRETQPTYGAMSSMNLQKVLVIDDDAAILLGMKALLESWDLKPILARSVEDALRVCGSRQNKPDLIISDLRLGNEVTGVMAIQRMHQHFRSNVPALLITGDTSPERIRLAYESPYPLLHKPIKPAQLRSVCTSILQFNTADSAQQA
ncbi:hybrid sensor histidine kinase/response regulator [Hahella sp. CCB-MM4]|uniref:ATP-binding response regulator n=1 Tax=Hahella sp. (strain CCB-MM4) TaxID=1926491 RepID=UPI000B9A3B1F|nr:hybrid sensor histidine kinase/response regulator [Hahella sp. CCB-MM4]OZG74623.1 hybrid sensor histidine kinase/response regulator [Hahella sp. CCB-MM4]